MFIIDNATIINLQNLKGLAIHPYAPVQGKRNYKMVRHLCTKHGRTGEIYPVSPKTGTIFQVEPANVAAFLDKLGLL